MLLIIIITALADGISTLWCKLANIRKVVLVSHYDIVNLVPGHWCSGAVPVHRGSNIIVKYVVKHKSAKLLCCRKVKGHSQYKPLIKY